MTNQNIDGIGKADTLLTDRLNQFVHAQPASIGFHRLDVLELESNLVDLVLDGGVSGDLHRGYILHHPIQNVKHFQQTFFRIFSALLACGRRHP